MFDINLLQKWVFFVVMFRLLDWNHFNEMSRLLSFSPRCPWRREPMDFGALPSKFLWGNRGREILILSPNQKLETCKNSQFSQDFKEWTAQPLWLTTENLLLKQFNNQFESLPFVNENVPPFFAKVLPVNVCGCASLLWWLTLGVDHRRICFFFPASDDRSLSKRIRNVVWVGRQHARMTKLWSATLPQLKARDYHWSSS